MFLHHNASLQGFETDVKCIWLDSNSWVTHGGMNRVLLPTRPLSRPLLCWELPIDGIRPTYHLGYALPTEPHNSCL